MPTGPLSTVVLYLTEGDLAQLLRTHMDVKTRTSELASDEFWRVRCCSAFGRHLDHIQGLGKDAFRTFLTAKATRNQSLNLPRESGSRFRRFWCSDQLLAKCLGASTQDTEYEKPERTLAPSPCAMMRTAEVGSLGWVGQLRQEECGCMFMSKCYWSSEPSPVADKDEWLQYDLVDGLAVVSSFVLTPYTAFWQPDRPTYNPIEACFQLTHPQIHGGAKPYYESPRFLVDGLMTRQQFDLPQPIVSLGGRAKVVLLGMAQRQTLPPDAGETANHYHVCISYVSLPGNVLLSCRLAEAEVTRSFGDHGIDGSAGEAGGGQRGGGAAEADREASAGHLEKLASNAKSIHHILEALCGGLDRLEKKMDTNSSQVEARLANIVHHMSGEADEDTMSAWSSLNGGVGSGSGGGLGSPGEITPALSLRRRSSMGMQMASFSEDPVQELQGGQSTLDSELAEVGRGSVVAASDGIGDVFGHIVERVKEAQIRQQDMNGEGSGEAGEEKRLAEEGEVASSPRGDNIPIEGAAEKGTVEPGNSSQPDGHGTGPIVDRGGVPSSDEGGDIVQEMELSPPPTSSSPSRSPSPSVPKRSQGEERSEEPSRGHSPTTVETIPAAPVPKTTNGPRDGTTRRRSNQDDQSSDIDSDSVRGADSSVTGGSGQEEEASRGGGSENLTSVTLRGSVESTGSDSRYIARQRWIWAFGRVCHLLRRRKRKQFEIMSQRATDRAVRMGSRVSVVEKRLDETKERLLLVGRLSDKSGTHTAQIHKLSETVTELCKLLGVEERFQATMHATQAKMHTHLKSELREAEAKLSRGHRELETTLEAEIRRNGTKLEDMEDRYARSEEALRRAEERIGEVQEEVSTVTHTISEVERQLRVDEERLDSLENLKKTHQRRLSELRVQLEGSAPAANTGGVVPMEPDETDDQRMARFLKAAATATEFLSADLQKILERNNNKRSSAGSAEAATESTQGQRNQETASNNAAEGKARGEIFQKLQQVSIEAAEFSRLCSKSTNHTGGGIERGEGNGDDGSGGNRTADAVPADDATSGAAIKRAEGLCGRIESLLSAAADDSDSDADCDLLKVQHRSRSDDPSRSDERQHSQGSDVVAGDRKPEIYGDVGDPAGERMSKREDCSHVGGIVCPNGRKDLPLRLAAARDALAAVIGERTSLGSLKVALRGLKSRVEEKEHAGLSEERLKELLDRVSGLDKSVSGIQDSLRSDGLHKRHSIDHDMDNGGGGAGGGEVTEADLEERLGFKADVSWVQRELQRLWDALDTRAMAAMAAMGVQQTGVRPRSAPSSNNSRSNKENDNPEMAGEEESDVTPGSRVISTSLPSSTMLSAGIGGGHGQRPSLNEGSSIIKDLLRKFSRLEQQVASKADNEEVTRALSSIGNKLRKVGVVIPALQEEVSNKVEKKDLTKLVALVSDGGRSTDGPPGSSNNNKNGSSSSNNNNNNNDTSAVLASRLNSKFRCLSCDRPLPALGPPGPPKLGSSGLSVAGAGAPRSPQRAKTQPGQQRLRLTAAVVGDEAFSRPSSPTVKSPTSEDVGDSDVAGWGGGGGSSSAMTLGTADNDHNGSGHYYSKGKDVGGRRRQQQHQQRGGDQPAGRLEPIGANGEQMTGVLSRYPRMMPPPSRVRTAAGGGIGSRPASSSGGRI
eukprot:g11107.t1